MRRILRFTRALAMVVVLRGGCGPLSAQAVERSSAAVPRAAAALPVEHWAWDALRRLDALGLVPEHLGGVRSLSRAAVAEELRAAATLAERRGEPSAGLARGWAERFAREHPVAASSDSRARAVELRLDAGYGDGTATTAREESAGGLGTLLAPPDGPDGLLGGAHATVYLGRSLAIMAWPTLDGDGARLSAFDVVAAAGAVEVAVGRGEVRYGVGEGILMSGGVALDRVQLQSRRPLLLPGRLRAAGPVGLHLFAAGLSKERHPGEPLLWGAGGEWRPHERLSLSLHRAAIFGGRNGPVPLTPRSVGRMLIGITSDGFDNQIVTGSVRYRLPSERLVPLTAYGEWGADDTAGAMVDSPGLLVGALLPFLPGVPGSGAGVEFAFFGNRCDRCPAVRDPHYWYRHFVYQGGWASGERPLAHPLGGNGTELRVYIMPATSGAASVRADGFVRRRDPENLYGPLWAGPSQGVRVRASWGPVGRAGAQAQWSYEAGDRWSASQLRILGSVFF